MKFTEDPQVVFGTAAGPEPGRVFMRGMFARAMGVLDAPPSKAIEVVHIVERRFPRVRVRGYHATVGGTMWVSPGYVTISLLRFTALWLRAIWRTRSEPIPIARIHR